MMPDFIQIRVCAGTGSWLSPMSQNAKVDDLFNLITRKYVIGINPSKMRLLCEDKYLEYGKEKCFKDYSLAHLSTVVALLPVCGGVWPVQSIKEKTSNLAPLPGFITVTSSPREPDMITFDDNPDEKRARMPCGHVIGPESMTSYCQNVLSEGKFKFYCPSVDEKTGKGNCNREWDYFLVRHVACLSSDEMKAFEKKISDNYLKKANGIQTCPGCKAWCYNGDGTGNYVRCPLCSKDFCWACLRGWIDPSNSRSCGNSDCDGTDSRTKLLAKCPTKAIGRCTACPTIRACPKCGMLTEHKDACGHITCPECHHGFCFICLKGKKGRGAADWPCCPSGTCTLAPRQTSTSWHAPANQPERQRITSSPAPASQPELRPVGWQDDWYKYIFIILFAIAMGLYITVKRK